MSNELDLPTVLEECAEHIRAGRDPRDYFEVSADEDEAGWVKPSSLQSIIDDYCIFKVRRKPTHKTPTEDDVGRLVMCDDGYGEKGPFILEMIEWDGCPYAAGGKWWPHAKLYTGPTRPNWIEHDGRGVPDEVKEAGKALCQMRDGSILVCPEHSLNWKHCYGGHDILRYTIINP